MKQADLVQGRTYALNNPDQVKREHEPHIKVRYLGVTHRRNAKVRFESGPIAGLDDWIKTRDLACRWGERKALLRDLERHQRLVAANRAIWDPVTEDAIDAVMTASGEYGGYLSRWVSDPAPAARFWRRAKLNGSPINYDPSNFINRHGGWWLTYATTLHAAQAYAAAEPHAVELYLRGWEDRLTAEGWQPGNRGAHEQLREWSPRWALARSWTQRPLGDAAEKEVQRLQAVVAESVQLLRQLGHELHATQIERALRGR